MNINQDENASNILKKIVESDQCYLDLEVKVFSNEFTFVYIHMVLNCS